MSCGCGAPAQGGSRRGRRDHGDRAVRQRRPSTARPSAARTSACSTRPASSPPRSCPHPRATSASSPPPATGRCARCTAPATARPRSPPPAPACTRWTSPSPDRYAVRPGGRGHRAASALGPERYSLSGGTHLHRPAGPRDVADHVVRGLRGLPAVLRPTLMTPPTAVLTRTAATRPCGWPPSAPRRRARRNLPQFDDLPIPADTANLRHGAVLHDALPAAAAAGRRVARRGRGRLPDDRRPVTGSASRSRSRTTAVRSSCYEARSWLLNEAGEVIRPAAREIGFWRPQPDDTIELLLVAPHRDPSSSTTASRAPRRRGSLATDAVVRTATAKEVTAAPSGSTASSTTVTSPTSRSVPWSASRCSRTPPHTCAASSADPDVHKGLFNNPRVGT